MAHNLASLNNSIMYAQLETLGLPWWANSRHPDGTIMAVNTWQTGASIEEMRASAGMAWDWIKLPAMVQVPGFANAVRAEGFSITCRSSDLAPLGQVSDDYQLHTLADVFDTFQALAAETAGGGWTISTMGALRQGRQIFAVAERGETVAMNPSPGAARPWWRLSSHLPPSRLLVLETCRTHRQGCEVGSRPKPAQAGQGPMIDR
jgi:hypothetical protein